MSEEENSSEENFDDVESGNSSDSEDEAYRVITWT
jgi:hypothetical protein